MKLKFNMKYVFLIGLVLFILSSPYLTSLYYQNVRDSSGSTYANMHKMLMDHGENTQLKEAIFAATDNGSLTGTEVNSIKRLYFDAHGTFEAVPLVVRGSTIESYEKEKYMELIDKMKLASNWGLSDEK